MILHTYLFWAGIKSRDLGSPTRLCMYNKAKTVMLVSKKNAENGEDLTPKFYPVDHMGYHGEIFQSHVCSSQTPNSQSVFKDISRVHVLGIVNSFTTLTLPVKMDHIPTISEILRQRFQRIHSNHQKSHRWYTSSPWTLHHTPATVQVFRPRIASRCLMVWPSIILNLVIFHLPRQYLVCKLG